MIAVASCHHRRSASEALADADPTVNLWGNSLAEHLDDIFGRLRAGRFVSAGHVETLSGSRSPGA